MERDPDGRYLKAADMKSELEHPEMVQLTGRRDRLQSPSVWRSRWHTLRIVLWTVLLTVIGIGLILFVFRKR